MAREIRQFTAVVPAGVTAAAPRSFDMSFPPRTVDTLEIIVPPGPSGVVGFAVTNSGIRVIPYNSDDWIITSNEKIVWPLNGYVDSGSWELLAYNTGNDTHSIYVRFLLSIAGGVGTSETGPSLIDETVLSSTGPAAADTVLSEGT